MKNKNQVSVFRVEHKTKKNPKGFYIGPYYYERDRDVWDKKRRHAISDDTPPPHRDVVLKTKITEMFCYTEYFFGFADVSQLKKWFNQKELKLLNSLNFVVREYIINKNYVIYGDKQVLFCRKKKKKCRKINYENL